MWDPEALLKNIGHYLSIYLSIFLSFLSIYLSIHPSILSILSIYLSICCMVCLGLLLKSCLGLVSNFRDEKQQIPNKNMVLNPSLAQKACSFGGLAWITSRKPTKKIEKRQIIQIINKKSSPFLHSCRTRGTQIWVRIDALSTGLRSCCDSSLVHGPMATTLSSSMIPSA